MKKIDFVELFNTLLESGCEIDTHESDLYVRVDEDSETIVATLYGEAKRFIGNPDGNVWFDIPFGNIEFWRQAAS